MSYYVRGILAGASRRVPGGGGAAGAGGMGPYRGVWGRGGGGA